MNGADKKKMTDGYGKRIELCGKGYLSARNYAEFLLTRLKNGGALGAVLRVYKKIRKYTLFTAVIRGVAAVIALLEKSAILLLFFSAFFLALPLMLIPLTVCAVISIIGYFRMNDAVKSWILGAERVTVYVTSERFFEREKARGERGRRRRDGTVTNGRAETEAERFARRPLFARCATVEAEEYTHPVIVVCSDPFLVARWAGFNLLAVKCDYFFILRRFYFSKTNVSYSVLS